MVSFWVFFTRGRWYSSGKILGAGGLLPKELMPFTIGKLPLAAAESDDKGDIKFK